MLITTMEAAMAAVPVRCQQAILPPICMNMLKGTFTLQQDDWERSSTVTSSFSEMSSTWWTPLYTHHSHLTV